MKTGYELWLTDSLGNRVAFLETVQDFTYTHATHSWGFFSVTLPGTFPRNQLDTTRRVCFFRKASPGAIAALDFVERLLAGVIVDYVDIFVFSIP